MSKFLDLRAAALGCVFLASSGLAACSANADTPGPGVPMGPGDASGQGDASGPSDTSDAAVHADVEFTGDGTDAGDGARCPSPMVGDLPCDVAQVLEICQNCHRDPPQRGAPFPFLTYEDTQAVYFGATRRWQRMAQVIEPNDPLHMPPRTATDVPQPTDEQLQTLRSWLASCTPPEPEHEGCDKGETP